MDNLGWFLLGCLVGIVFLFAVITVLVSWDD